MEDDKGNLEDLKKKYSLLRERYILPEFSELNELFDIEEIDSDTEFLLRKIRRNISEKVLSYLRFAETFLNPSNAPVFFFKLIKKLGNSEREILTKLTDSLGSLEVEMMLLDLDYDEKKEAEFINKTKEFLDKEIKQQMLLIVNKLNNEKDDLKSDTGSYFG